ncbi:hypothetical protein QN277_008816 [Acacia crassicarpa]|uniref:Uncharacterized protein n=1 Tax=Acacia crassicarpa TaxID=499986 RepID=A0AAE1M8K3_9FABA|nr:hypothetical protein QN277_008816 [Acacia crassicarpa]
MEFKNKTAGYHLVPPEEHNMKESPIYNDEDGERENKKKKKKEKKGKKKIRHRRAFWVCCSNVRVGSRELFQDDNKKKREELDEGGFKVKEEGFLFSDIEIEPKEDVEKVKELVEKMNQKSCFFVCCSSVQVAK